ncbi:MAG: SH3 domain-containing protein [Pyrinomonadaceae bacterium]|nr:SH3 domain-containing protein [Pyrinomonadaceae bacterium]
MKKVGLIILVIAGLSVMAIAQKKRVGPGAKPRVTAVAKAPEIGQTAIVIDETLSVLRKNPSLFSEAVHRMSRGRKVQILGVTEADGVKFYKVTVPPKNFGWVQADAVFGKFHPSDEDRLSKLVQASTGFDQIEIAQHFFALFPSSKLRPALLLLYGDLLEETAGRLSKEAAGRLNRREMAASAAPMHSYYLNFNMLDRYRRLGVIFLFNPTTRQYHYDGASWKEIVARFATSSQVAEATKRLETLKLRMDKK